MKIIITLQGLDHISKENLKKWGFDSELDYYIDVIYTDPPLLLDEAFYEIVED